MSVSVVTPPEVVCCPRWSCHIAVTSSSTGKAKEEIHEALLCVRQKNGTCNQLSMQVRKVRSLFSGVLFLYSVDVLKVTNICILLQFLIHFLTLLPLNRRPTPQTLALVQSSTSFSQGVFGRPPFLLPSIFPSDYNFFSA